MRSLLHPARISLIFILLGWCTGIAKATGPLKVDPAKPRYFTDTSGTVVYLSGAHLNNNFIDRSDKPTLDFSGYLDFLQKHNLNFVRLWVWEQAAWSHESADKIQFEPQAYLRTGPGYALDGKPKFDLTRFDQTYFDRLRLRVSEARAHGIYVSVMLFQGLSTAMTAKGGPWRGHPFHRDNNINGIDGDPSGDSSGEEVHSLTVPAITKLQEDYTRKIIDTLNDFDNVLYEISGETSVASKDWQYHMVEYVKNYQKTKAHQHPVGMSYLLRGTEEELFAGPADWILLLGTSANPEPGAGNKVIIQDMDSRLLTGKVPWQWVWKSFIRGYNPIYMDADPFDAHLNTQVRESFSDASSFAQILDLSSMSPSDACSTGFCLVSPGLQYLAYLPSGGNVTVDLSAGRENFAVHWFDPLSGQNFSAVSVRGGSKVALTPPFKGEAVLYLVAESQAVASAQVSGQSATQARGGESSSFALSGAGTLSAVPGSSAMTNITATLTLNRSFQINFSVSGLPQGSSATFSRSSCRPTCSTMLTVNTSSSTPAGDYTVLVKATGTEGERSSSLTLHVADAPTVEAATAANKRAGATTPFDYSLSNSGDKSVAVGAKVANSIRATLNSGRTQRVSFSVSGLPSGATASFSALSCSPTCSRTLTIKTNTSTPAGSFPITVSASGGGLVRTTTFILAVGQTTATPPVTSTSGLVAHWRFDEGSGTSAADASGNGNTATLVNSPAWSSGVAGGALYFDGVDDNLIVSNSASLNLSGSFTLSAWVNPATAFTDFRSILVKNYTYYLYASTTGNCGDGNPLGGFSQASNGGVCQGPSLPPNTWTHLALTYDGSTLTLYRNGVAVAGAAASGALSASTEPLQIGASQYGEYFNGLIDEVRIYNRGLTATEIQSSYLNESSGISAPTTVNPPVNPGGSAYYVAGDGNDANPGTISQPFRTIAKGLSALQAGSKLYLRSGTYAETINSNNQTIPTGTSWNDAPLISAYPGETVVLRPGSAGEVINLAHSSIQYVIFNGLTLDATNAGYGVSGWGGAHHVRFQNGVIKNASKSGVLLAHGNGLSSDYFEFINMKIQDNGLSLFDHGLYIATSHNLVDGCEIYNNVGYGIHVYNGAPGEQANNNILRGNTIHHNALVDVSSAGIILSSGDGNFAYNNIVRNNSYGISVNYRATNSKVYNNVAYANTYYGIDVGAGSSTASIVNNIVYQNGWTISDVGSATALANNMTTDPQFVNPTGNDFRLQATSPAIDAGAALADVMTDFAGVPRPQRGAYDIGAFEFQ